MSPAKNSMIINTFLDNERSFSEVTGIYTLKEINDMLKLENPFPCMINEAKDIFQCEINK